MKKILTWLLFSTCTSLLMGLVGSGQAYAGSYEDFFIAIKNDQTEKVFEILNRGFDPNTFDPDGHPALVAAARNKSFRTFELLLKQKTIKVDVRNMVGETPLMYAAILGKFDWVKQIVKMGGQINQTSWAPLHYAASGGFDEIVSWLLDNHAYIDAQSENEGITPLMLAARAGHLSTVKLLIEQGADAHLLMKAKKTALDYALANNHQEVAVELRKAPKR